MTQRRHWHAVAAAVAAAVVLLNDHSISPPFFLHHFLFLLLLLHRLLLVLSFGWPVMAAVEQPAFSAVAMIYRRFLTFKQSLSPSRRDSRVSLHACVKDSLDLQCYQQTSAAVSIAKKQQQIPPLPSVRFCVSFCDASWDLSRGGNFLERPHVRGLTCATSRWQFVRRPASSFNLPHRPTGFPTHSETTWSVQYTHTQAHTHTQVRPEERIDDE